MGCDIHMFVEVKLGDSWGVVTPEALAVDGPVQTKQELIAAVVSAAMYNDYGSGWELEVCGGRDYSLFALLAGVRNCGNARVPLAPARGLPSDVSSTVAKLNDWWGDDAHSSSYFYCSELLDYNWLERGSQFDETHEFTGDLLP